MDSREDKQKMRDKNASRVLFGVLVALVVIGGTTGAVWINKTRTEPVVATRQAPTPEAPAFTKAAQTARVAYDGVAGKTALELLKAKTSVVTKDSQYGPYVDSIDGIKAGDDNKYWSFYINGK